MEIFFAILAVLMYFFSVQSCKTSRQSFSFFHHCKLFHLASPGQMYIYRIAAKNDALEYFGPHSAHVTAFAASLPGITRNLGYVASTRPAGTGSVVPGGC